MTPRLLARLHPDLDRRLVRLAAQVAALTALVLVLAQPDLPERAYFAPSAERTLRALAAEPGIRAVLAEQNRALAGAPEAWTDAAEAAWSREALEGGGSFLNAVLRRPASRSLRAMVRRSPVVRHAALYDRAGRIAAAAQPLPAYRFAREPGWAALAALPPGARHVGPREPGHAQTFAACWVTLPLRDPSGALAGALALELDAEVVGATLCR
ncbi:MAG TPA: hypothetical protein VEA41_05515 [Salinarimonas sp.]|nr:hypothetical protein [Salinarimonas sp.]